MDPLAVEAARTAAAIATGALVGWLTARWGLRNAERLSREDRDRREAAVRRALVSEIDENLRRIGDTTSRSPTHIERSAWDAARELALPDNVCDDIAAAYAIGADLNSRIAIVDNLLGRGAYADPNSDWSRQATAHHREQVSEMNRTAVRAREAFEKARDELRKA